MGVQEEPIPPIWMHCPSPVLVWNGRDCLRKIGIHRQLDLARAVRHPDLRVIRAAQIRDSLLLGFAPKIVERHIWINVIEPPKPVARERRIRFPRYRLPTLLCIFEV